TGRSIRRASSPTFAVFGRAWRQSAGACPPGRAIFASIEAGSWTSSFWSRSVNSSTQPIPVSGPGRRQRRSLGWSRSAGPRRCSTTTRRCAGPRCGCASCSIAPKTSSRPPISRCSRAASAPRPTPWAPTSTPAWPASARSSPNAFSDAAAPARPETPLPSRPPLREPRPPRSNWCLPSACHAGPGPHLGAVADGADSERRGRGIGFWRIFGDVRRGEGTRVALLGLQIFLLLSAYYLLKTVREPLILLSRFRGLGGAELKIYATSAQALLLLAVLPLYARLASRVSRLDRKST